MQKYVRTYGFYEDKRCEPRLIPWDNGDGIKQYRLDRASDMMCFPNHFVAHFRYALDKSNDPVQLLQECAEFASEYPDPCAVLLSGNGKDHVLTQKVHTLVFAKMPRDREFMILFNARPTSCALSPNFIIDVGFDRYGIKYDPDSIIVWDGDRYQEALGDKYKLWGIYNNTGIFKSFSDDLLAYRTDDGLITAL